MALWLAFHLDAFVPFIWRLCKHLEVEREEEASIARRVTVALAKAAAFVWAGVKVGEATGQNYVSF